MPLDGLFGRNRKIVKIEKYVPFRTSGNRNLYLGCNRRTALSGPKMRQRRGETILPHSRLLEVETVSFEERATIPAHSLTEWIAVSSSRPPAFGLRDKSENHSICPGLKIPASMLAGQGSRHRGRRSTSALRHLRPERQILRGGKECDVYSLVSWSS
jgi:hypothetical protein